MTQPESIVQEMPPDEAELRRHNIFFTVDIGTPWDAKGHIHLTGSMSREEFVFDGPGSLTTEIMTLAAQAEAFIREEMIPRWNEGTMTVNGVAVAVETADAGE